MFKAPIVETASNCIILRLNVQVLREDISCRAPAQRKLFIMPAAARKRLKPVKLRRVYLLQALHCSSEKMLVKFLPYE